MSDSLSATLYDLEDQLLRPEVRQSPPDIDRLIADEFVEFSSSGRIYSKQNCIGGMPTIHASMSHFKAEALAPDVALVTYRVAISDESGPEVRHSLRSSIWKRQGGRWQVIFHQGTLTPGPD